MSRPTNKPDLLAAMQKEHAALEKLLAPLSPEQLCRHSELTGYAIKDVLAHLFAWEQMVLGWYAAGLRGDKPALPAEGYNWAQLPALNRRIYEIYRDLPLDEILRQFRLSYQQTLETVQSIAEADLFTAGRYAWTGKNTLGAYFVSCSSSHYDWAKKEVKKCLKPQE
jgi:hypothetical protein